METLTTSDIDRSITNLEAEIARLREQRRPTLLNEKRRLLLKGSTRPADYGVPVMEDECLAKCCRDYRLTSFIFLLSKVFGGAISTVPDMEGKTIADVLHVAEYAYDDEKLELLSFPEEGVAGEGL